MRKRIGDLMRVAILGGGHGCFAAAADLAEQGHSVSLWRRSAGQFADLVDHRTIRLTDVQGARDVKINCVTGDLGEALADAQLIVLPTPAFAQSNIALALAPHLVDGQVIFLAPGTFGCVAMAQVLRDEGCTAQVTFAETGTLPYLARKHDASAVTITIRAQRLPTGVFPSARTNHAMRVIQDVYPSVHPIEDALSGALMNAGPIIHPPLILMNAGPLEHFEQWDIHNEGTQPSIRRVTDALDDERIAVREALGYQPYHYPLRDHYQTNKWMYGDAHKKLTDSGDWREKIVLASHRYMTEDVAYGLTLLVSVGCFAGIHTPVANGLLAIARATFEKEFPYGERSLETLGLAGLTREEMTALLTDGTWSTQERADIE